MMRFTKKTAGLSAALLMVTGLVFAEETKSTPESAPTDFSGIYAGVFAAHSWTDLDYSEPDYGSDYNRYVSMTGLRGGAFFGYNHRIDNFVIGAEVDAGRSNLNEDNNQNAFYNNYTSFKIKWDSHARLKAGMIVGPTLFYVAGGLAMANVTVDDTDPGYGRSRSTYFGWTIGAGVERMLTEHLALRCEYLYDGYNGKRNTIDSSYGDDYRAKVDLSSQAVRLGLAYCF